MKIWLETLTGKQSILMHHLAEKFEAQGHEILITARPYSIDRANSNLDRLGRNYISIGEYGGATLTGKLKASASRILELTDVVNNFQPDMLIAFPSPDAFRIAFGLGIKSIQINDSPHSQAPAKLTISLSNALVHSKAIGSDQFSKHGVTSFYPYNGVDELLWIKGFQPNEMILSELGVEKEKFIVVRCEESKAGYFQRLYPGFPPGGTIVEELVDELLETFPEIKIIAFPRYKEQENALRQKDVIIPKMSVDTLSLYTYAKAVMTGGGTMGREAALMGTPTLYTFPLSLEVSEFVIELGFPLYHCPDNTKVTQEMIRLINSQKMDKNEQALLLSELETPYEGIQRALTDLGYKI